MDFASIRIVTADLDRLAAFYEAVTGLAAEWSTRDFAEIVTSRGTLALAHERTLALFGTDLARPAANASVIVEFLVDDVDARYEAVRATTHEVVQEPTTMSWGNRSLLVRDPDGTLVNLFTPVTPEAVARSTADPGGITRCG